MRGFYCVLGGCKSPLAKALCSLGGGVGLLGIVVAFLLLFLIQKITFSETLFVAGLVAWMIEDTKQNGWRQILKIFGNKTLSKIGVFAYSLYLVHEPLEQIIWQYGIRNLTDNKNYHFLILLAATCIVVVPTSYLFFLIFEEPFLERDRFERFYKHLTSKRIFASR